MDNSFLYAKFDFNIYERKKYVKQKHTRKQ